MFEAFNAADAPLAGLWPALVVLALLAGCAAWKLTGRKLAWWVPAGLVVIGLAAGVAPIWDQLRLRRMAASGVGLTVTRGPIDQTWHIVERRRDYSGSGTSAKYKTVVSEGFDIGQDRFSWVIGGCLSPASLCDLTASRVPLVKGMEAEVTWFADPAQQDERRIVRLRLQAPR
jgi:hypothetical protein